MILRFATVQVRITLNTMNQLGNKTLKQKIQRFLLLEIKQKKERKEIVNVYQLNNLVLYFVRWHQRPPCIIFSLFVFTFINIVLIKNFKRSN